MFSRMEEEAENLKGAEPAAQPPLGEWRAPVFWMACGALLAGLAVGAVVLVQRVGLERDMAAVAGMLPPPAAALRGSDTPAAGAASGPVRPSPASADASELAAAAGVAAPPLAEAANGPAAAAADAPATAAAVASVARRAPASVARGAGAAAARKPPASQARKAAARLKAKAHAKRKPPPESTLYWEVFKRCPLPGEPGAVECRRHICNGAEREGPACNAYRKKWR